MKFKDLLNEDFVLLDGAMGTMLQQNGLAPGQPPELSSIIAAELVAGIHSAYEKAGAQIIYANTFGANRLKLAGHGYSVAQVATAAVQLAKKSAPAALIALDMSTLGQLLEPTGTLTFEEAYDAYAEAVAAGAAAGADVIVIETMTDLYEMKAAVLAAKEHSDLPILATMTFEQNMRTFTGCSISSMALTLEGLGVDALGMNCSLGPKEMYPIVEELSRWTRLPIVVKPNAGLPDPETGGYDIDPEKFADYMLRLIPLGVKFFGGCCGTTPAFIALLREKLTEAAARPENPFRAAQLALAARPPIPAAICSPSRTLCIDQPRIIGERINPTGKKLFKEALKNKDMDYILSQAIQQVEAGADALDVNVGLPEIDEPAMMTETVKALQAIVDVPLQIDSSDPKAVEAGLRVYCGKAIVNSVNGEEKSLAAILPLVKKYGAAVVGLTLDERGIPKTAEARFEIAQRILSRALALGIKREDVYIDCLTLTASAEQENVQGTLRALRRIKEELGLKTVLGVSNISFGLPNRGLINQTFLTMALSCGLDLPIINPNDAPMTGAVRAYKLLTCIDENSLEYIAAYSQASSDNAGGGQPAGASQARPAGTAADKTAKGGQGAEMTLAYAVERGLKNDGARLTRQLLETVEPMVIINEMLIPALDKAGADFESGRSFLPQLILSASVAQAAFDEIKQKLAKNDAPPVSRGKIVLATVKGDIHDIGKNIVKVLLENYGYDVIDLGRDVDYQAVVDAARKHEARLVGLSALMTTTLKSMEQTIALLRENRLDCSVMVGGAVLTPDYAGKIGADFYAKDAKESIDIAKKLLG